MSKRIDDMNETQKDYAVFLPAISGFLATIIGKQRFSPYVDLPRVPAGLEYGIEGLNWTNSTDNYFKYQWNLYSAGHADLDLTKLAEKEDMIRNRDPNSWIIGDSGGFQIGKGVWEADWKDPTCPKAQKKREEVFTWLENTADYAITLDIPAWLTRSPAGQIATGITTYEQAVAGTEFNNEYFIRNRSQEKCKFLNTLQGESHAQADDWYNRMKKFNDPKVYPDVHFDGWAMAGQNMCDVHLTLKRLVELRFDGFLEQGLYDWMHFLGISKLEWACLLTDVQRAVRKNVNPDFTMSFDCASPFLATANGSIYVDTLLPPNKKWSYRMVPSIDNKKFAHDMRSLKQGILDEHINEAFIDSPISERLTVGDICHYAAGDLNKNGKEGRTSWDSFSYGLQMVHNVWSHIYSVQESNRQYDRGIMPNLLVSENINRTEFREVVNEIFEIDDRDKALELVEHYSKFWTEIPGVRGMIGKKTVNALSMGAELDTTDAFEKSNPMLDKVDREVLRPDGKMDELFGVTTEEQWHENKARKKEKTEERVKAAKEKPIATFDNLFEE